MDLRKRIFRDDYSQKTYRHWYKRNSSYLIDSQVPYREYDHYHEYLDVVTPQFKLRSARGEIINSPMMSCEFESYVTPGLASGKGQCSTLDSYTLGMVIPTPSVYSLGRNPNYDTMLAPYSSDRDVAIAQSFANVDESEIAALASLGEMPETLRWIASIYLRFNRLLSMLLGKRLKKKRKKNGSVIDGVSDYWLEFRYAIRPLVFEMQQALTALQAAIQKNSRKTARGWNRDIQAPKTTLEMIESPLEFLWPVVHVQTYQHNYRAGVLYNIESDINGLLSVWGLDQPLEAAWELTRLSFVFDWFFNVGDIISSWSINPSLRVLTNWVVESHSFIDIYYPNGDCSRKNYHCNWNIEFKTDQRPAAEFRLRITRRIPLADRPLMPTVRIKLDALKLIDLAFIGRQLLMALIKR